MDERQQRCTEKKGLKPNPCKAHAGGSDAARPRLGPRCGSWRRKYSPSARGSNNKWRIFSPARKISMSQTNFSLKLTCFWATTLERKQTNLNCQATNVENGEKDGLFHWKWNEYIGRPHWSLTFTFRSNYWGRNIHRKLVSRRSSMDRIRYRNQVRCGPAFRSNLQVHRLTIRTVLGWARRIIIHLWNIISWNKISIAFIV
jgi:hypothetical protein